MHASRLLSFNFEGDPNLEKFKRLAASDKDKFVVKSIIDLTGDPKYRSTLQFRVRWLGFDESEVTWLPYRAVKALEIYFSGLGEFHGF